MIDGGTEDGRGAGEWGQRRQKMDRGQRMGGSGQKIDGGDRRWMGDRRWGGGGQKIDRGDRRWVAVDRRLMGGQEMDREWGAVDRRLTGRDRRWTGDSGGRRSGDREGSEEMEAVGGNRGS